MRTLLTPAVRERLARIQDNAETFTPNETVLSELGKKSLTMLVGPCAVGKSYLIDQIVTRDSSFRKSRSFTSRGPRGDDTPETIRYIKWTDQEIDNFCQTIEQGDFVNFTFHPESHEIYGTTLADHPGKHNLMPSLTKSVASLESLPFRHTATIGLATEPKQWQDRFDTREFTGDADRSARIVEGITSLQWLLEHPNASIVTNALNTNATDRIQHIVKTMSIERDEATAVALLRYLQSLA